MEGKRHGKCSLDKDKCTGCAFRTWWIRFSQINPREQRDMSELYAVTVEFLIKVSHTLFMAVKLFCQETCGSHQIRQMSVVKDLGL